MRYAALIYFTLFFCGCASMPPTAKLIEQAEKNADAIEEVEESDLPEPVKARVTTAIKDTQKLAVQSSEAWEKCKSELADAEEARWKWAAIAGIIGIVGGFLLGRKSPF